MKLFYKLLKQTPGSRDGAVIVTSALHIVMNLVLGGLKIAMGAALSSVAIISEGVNNATDCATSLIAIVGTKLAGKRPDKKHPFGYGRIEYLTSLIIAVLILFSGFEMLKSCVELIITPEENLAINYLSMAVIAVSAVVKFLMGQYTIKVGKRVESGSLVGLGSECRGDSLMSAVTIVSALSFLLFAFSLDAWAGAITSLLIIKAGFDVLRDTVSQLLGKAGDEELAQRLYKRIRSEPIILNAADMMLHNYGPDAYSGSVNVEVDKNHSIGEIYKELHSLQLKIMHEMGVTMVFGLYAVDHDSPASSKMRGEIAAFVRERKHIISYHALYLSQEEMRIYCDFVVDYELRDYEALEKEFASYMKELYPDYSLELVIETEYV